MYGFASLIRFLIGRYKQLNTPKYTIKVLWEVRLQYIHMYVISNESNYIVVECTKAKLAHKYSEQII
jgi:hypothetical protein